MLSRALAFVAGIFSSNKTSGPVVVSFDVAYDDEPTVFDLERLQINQEGHIVGATAIIQNNSVSISSGRLPSGYRGSKPIAELFLKDFVASPPH